MNWKLIEQKTQEIEPKANTLLKEWLKKNKEWDGFLFLASYPPRICIDLEIHGKNTLSDKQLSDFGEITTAIANEFNLTGKTYVKHNKIRCTMWITKAEKAIDYK